MKENIVTELFNSLKRRPEIQALIPMGYTAGIPVLSSRQDELCVEIPFLRYRTTGVVDQTFVYPVKYLATYVVPEMKMVAFVDFAFTDMAKNVDFNKPIGKFRHEAIKNLNRQQYNELRTRTLNGLDILAASLLGEIAEDHENEKRLARDLSLIVEPSLFPFYESLSSNFFKSFITHGQNK